MKTREEVERRLRKLQIRYARKHVQRSQERLPHNCVHNEEHLPPRLEAGPKVPVEEEVAPRQQVTLVVLNEPRPIRLCMHGADRGEKWRGDVCDDAETARQCPYFKPAKDVRAARDEFMDSLADDEHVFNHYRDVATLQWVLGERVHSYPLAWWQRLWLAVHLFFIRVVKPTAALPAPRVPDDLWDDHDPPASP